MICIIAGPKKLVSIAKKDIKINIANMRVG